MEKLNRFELLEIQRCVSIQMEEYKSIMEDKTNEHAIRCMAKLQMENYNRLSEKLARIIKSDSKRIAIER